MRRLATFTVAAVALIGCGEPGPTKADRNVVSQWCHFTTEGDDPWRACMEDVTAADVRRAARRFRTVEDVRREDRNGTLTKRAVSEAAIADTVLENPAIYCGPRRGVFTPMTAADDIGMLVFGTLIQMMPVASASPWSPT